MKKVVGIPLVNGIVSKLTALSEPLIVTVKLHGVDTADASIGPKPTVEKTK